MLTGGPTPIPGCLIPRPGNKVAPGIRLGPTTRWGLRMHPYAIHAHPSRIRMQQYASIQLICAFER